MRRPSFQFYPADWQGNSNLKRCTHEEKGVWIDVLCVLHDQEEYGIVRWPLKELARAACTTLPKLRALVAKGVLKGADEAEACAAMIYTPRSGRRDGTSVVLVSEQPGPMWYSSRMVRDEHVRKSAGASTRFTSSKAQTDEEHSQESECGKLRARVLMKNDGKCHHCNILLGEQWEIDHLVPRSKGGRHSFDNMLLSCVACYQDKSDTLQDEWDSPRRSPSQRLGEDKGDGSSSSSSSSSSKYKFRGETVRLNEADYSRLKSTFYAIPDFEAELGAADKYYTGKKETGWYFALDSWMNRSHQTHLGRQKPDVPWKERPGNRMPSPAGG